MSTIWRVGNAVGTLVVVVSIAGCSNGDKQLANGDLGLTGTIHSVQASDGSTCWTLTSTSGKTYELQPAQAPQDLLVDGKQATITAKPRSGGSFCKMGQIIDVVRDTTAKT
ncbi:MAG TPA: hypothetical protein VK679_03940 [Gemmatimonadaceae bacterium]|jgi:hypothetical protein|nr:hypothetical protein [Gemmatimonadaceae bacterium]